LSAALDPTQWTAIMADLIGPFAATGIIFAVLDPRYPQPTRFDLVGFGTDIDRALAEYSAVMAPTDPQTVFVRNSSGSRVFADTDHIVLSDPATANYIAWQEDRLAVRHHISCASDIGPLVAGVAIHRTAAQGHVGRDERALLRAVQRRLEPAMLLGFRHAALLQEARWSGMASGSAEAACLLDERGQILRTTAAFDRYLAIPHGLSVRQSRLFAQQPAVDAALQAMIARSTRHPAAEPGAVAIAGPGGAALMVSAFPIDRERHLLPHARLAAMIVVTDRTRADNAADRVLRQAFGFTAQEVRVADLLAAGDDLKLIAERLAISRETARIHLRNLFAKTGTHRQADLVRLLVLLGQRR
jgi:DNA-binding CsgD family transcriptional regulator